MNREDAHRDEYDDAQEEHADLTHKANEEAPMPPADEEAKDYRKAMDVLIDLRECLHRLRVNGITDEAEIADVYAKLHTAIDDFEEKLTAFLGAQPPHATEVIMDRDRDKKEWTVEPVDTEKNPHCKPWMVSGPTHISYMFDHEEHANRLCSRLNVAQEMGWQDGFSEAHKLLVAKEQENRNLRKQVDLLGKDIMALGINLPRFDDDHRNGMGVCEAAAIGLKELKERCTFLEDHCDRGDKGLVRATELLFEVRTVKMPALMRDGYDSAIRLVKETLAPIMAELLTREAGTDPSRVEEFKARNEVVDTLAREVDKILSRPTEERPGLTIPEEFWSFAEKITEAQDGDTIKVPPGVHTTKVPEHLVPETNVELVPLLEHPTLVPYDQTLYCKCGWRGTKEDLVQSVTYACPRCGVADHLLIAATKEQIEESNDDGHAEPGDRE